MLRHAKSAAGGFNRAQLLPRLFEILLVCSLAANAPPAQAPSGLDHQFFTQVLQDHVKDGAVDYRALQTDARCLAALQQTDPGARTDRREWLAFWLNACNAFTLQICQRRVSFGKLDEQVLPCDRQRWV